MRYLLRLPIFFAILSTQAALAQAPIPSISTEEADLSVYIEGEKGNFPHQNLPNPFYYTLAITATDTLSIVSEQDSIAFVVEPETSMIFDVVRQMGKDTLHCIFTIVEKQEHAIFSKAYQRSHQGKTFVEIPQVYELVNIIYALTPNGKTDNDIVRQGTSYYDEVLAYFNGFDQHPVVNTFDSLLKTDNYHVIKMDAYAFDLTKSNNIKPSDIYNVVSWGEVNTLRPYVAQLEDFAQKTDFAAFYRSNQALYQAQIKTYQDTIDTQEMKLWLGRNFPDTQYNALKIIFSPLVNGNQSSTHFENDGFKELQAHVNYPYKGEWLQQYSPELIALLRGDIVFTELNHGYINPESEKEVYADDIRKAFQKMDDWIETDKPAGNYNSAYACFNEYMNWALVSLRYADHVQAEDLPGLVKGVEQMMVNNRGFKKFPEFNQFLLKLYQSRSKEQVLADLYPSIIDWFKQN